MAEHAVRPVRLLQLGDRILAQGYPGRRDRLLQMAQPGRTHDRSVHAGLAEQPCQRDLRHGHPVTGRDGPHRVHDIEVSVLVKLVGQRVVAGPDALLALPALAVAAEQPAARTTARAAPGTAMERRPIRSAMMAFSVRAESD